MNDIEILQEVIETFDAEIARLQTELYVVRSKKTATQRLIEELKDNEVPRKIYDNR